MPRRPIGIRSSRPRNASAPMDARAASVTQSMGTIASIWVLNIRKSKGKGQRAKVKSKVLSQKFQVKSSRSKVARQKFTVQNSKSNFKAHGAGSKAGRLARTSNV